MTQARSRLGEGCRQRGLPMLVPSGTHASCQPDLRRLNNMSRTMRLANPGLVAGGAALLAAGAGGAYLYHRKRAEKSLSSMQHD